MENNKISKIEFSNSDKNKLNEFLSYEREAAIYDLISENYFEIIDEKVSKLPTSILEIIFYQSNIAIVWDEMLGTDELLKIKEAILKI